MIISTSLLIFGGLVSIYLNNTKNKRNKNNFLNGYIFGLFIGLLTIACSLA